MLIVEQKFRADPLDQRIRLVTLIASPYSGADLAATVSTLKSSAQLEDLHPGSDFIDELNEHWEGWYQRARPRDLTVRSIYAEADKIVPVDSARRLDPEAVPILGVGHTNIFDKANSDSEIVLTLRRFLAEAGMLTS